VQRVVRAAGVPITWDTQPLDDGRIPDALIASLRATRVGLMAYHQGPHDRDEQPPIVSLRNVLGIFANVRPIRTLQGVPSRHRDLDVVIVRETTEDIYAHLEHESIPGVFESLKVTTQAACERIARFAFQYALENGRSKVTIVHKANIMKRSDGMFLRVARGVAAEFPTLKSEDVIVDALCMKLVLDPSKFDVLVAGNLYGDIVSDLGAGLAGGASNCPSINVSPELRIFAAPHGDPAGLQGSNRGNPLVLLMPTVEMLRHLGERDAATRIRDAIEAVLTSPCKPFAIGGTAGCSQFASAVCERLA
jgi:isocitrate dehydrogenase (NAD+)